MEDLAVVIFVKAEEVRACRRLMDLDTLLLDKFLEARKEIDRFLQPEVLK